MRATAQNMTAAPPAVQATASAVEVGKLARMAPLPAANQLAPMATQDEAENIGDGVGEDTGGQPGAGWAQAGIEHGVSLDLG
jgi:hypothetical protein